MKKRQRKNRSTAFGNETAKGAYSGLDSHKRHGSKLITPFNAALGGAASWISWRDTGMHEMLWAVLIRGNMNQSGALQLFRLVVQKAKLSSRDHKETFISHSVLSILSDDVFDEIFEPVLHHPDAQNILPSLLFFDCLPDRHHWVRHLKKPDPNVHSGPLMDAVAVCLDHQSQAATDIRWLKVVYFVIVCGRLHFAMEEKGRSNERVEELRLYPNYGDQRTVRPTIRATEIMLRGPDGKTKSLLEVPQTLRDRIPEPWHEQFWKECLEKTLCIPPRQSHPPQVNVQAYQEQILELLQSLSEHFIATLTSTDVDAKRDSSFGLAMYGVFLCFGLTRVHQGVEGRIILRTIVEIFITLRFLAHHDNPTIWRQFRNYGNGQAKLSFLKNLRSTELPSFVNMDDLERYASEDIWQEFVDIDLKSWSNRNLRSMSEEIGVKDVYDKYYDWSSGYVHGNWSSIRDTLFTTCLNPLHRFHRIPFIPRFDMPSTLPDATRLVNKLLDVIAQLFPPFKARIKHPEPESTPTDEDAD